MLEWDLNLKPNVKVKVAFPDDVNSRRVL